jgi:hypothetical protein
MISKHIVQRFISSGINVIGLNSDKTPAEGYWTRWQGEMRVAQEINSDYLGLICGKISGGMEVIDVDTKYDVTGTLYERFKELLNDNKEGLYERLMEIQTKSGGYHLIYRCDKVEGNQKLARRPLTDEEKKTSREKWMVLLETRGEGGYIASFPSEGYKVLRGKFSEIPKITEEEREIIISCARTFDEEIKEVYIPKSTMNISGKTPWDDYNEREDGVSELLNHGWTIARESTNRIYLKRSGETTAPHSGNYLRDRKLFKAFSSSTDFEPEKAYPPFGVYAVLNHGGDFSSAAKELYKMGYGEQKKILSPIQQYEKAWEQPKEDEDIDLSMFVSDDEENDKYCDDTRSGKIQRGLTTGSVELDEYFVYKPSSLVMGVGHTNVGKTITMLFLKMIPAVLHNWRVIIISMENKSGFIKRKLMEMYMCRPLSEMTDEEYSLARSFVNKQFTILRGRGGLIKDIPRLMKVLYKMTSDSEYNSVLIDPYSAFEKSAKGENTHEYDYRMVGEFLDFTERTKVSMFLNAHTSTQARRQSARDDDGLLKAPFMDDVEGGGKFPNRVDTSIIFHRKTNAEAPICYTTEFYNDKERETETGGRPTPRDSPVNLVSGHGLTEFFINGANPIRKWHEEHGTLGFKKPETVEQALSRMKQNTDFDKQLIEDDEELDAPF